MLMTIVCRSSIPSAVRLVLKQPSLLKVSIPKNSCFRTFAEDAKDSFSQRLSRRRTLREKAMEPATDTAFDIGKGAIAGGAALGLGALCYYGLGLSKEAGAVDRAALWPKYVKDRIKATYMYFGASLAFTAGSAAMLYRSPAAMRLLSFNSFTSIAVTMAAVIGSVALVHSIPYKPGFGPKQMAWILHTGIIGGLVAPLCFLGGPILVRAAWYTAGIVGALSTVAVCAPSEKFLTMGGPLAIGLGVIFAASAGTFFFPPNTALGAGLYSLSLYGGLLLFSAFLLYNTQRIIKNAERVPPYASDFDPVNEAISIYADTINIFMRIAILLAGGGQRRK